MQMELIDYSFPQFNISLALFSFAQTYSFSTYLYSIPSTSDSAMVFFKAKNYFLSSSNFM